MAEWLGGKMSDMEKYLNNANLKVEVLADNIVRVRMARDGRWPESAMNRYGVIADRPVRAGRDSLVFSKVAPGYHSKVAGVAVKIIGMPPSTVVFMR